MRRDFSECMHAKTTHVFFAISFFRTGGLGLAGFWAGGCTRHVWRSRLARWAGQDLDRSGCSPNWTKPAGDVPPCSPITNRRGVLGALEPCLDFQAWVGSPAARRPAASRISRRRDVLVPTRSWCGIERVLRPPWCVLRI